MLNIIKLSLVNLFALVGTFIGFGLCFGVVENLNNKFIYSAFGRVGILITGSVGTIVHESSHLLMALIFGHKIEEVKFFKPISSSSDNVLGYVNHSYNKNNLYNNIGNFFIGIAPLIGGTILIFLLFKFLVPSGYEYMKNNLNINAYISALNSFNIIEFLKLLSNDLLILMKTLITNFNLYTFVFIILMYSISTYMGLSGADLKGSLNGLIFLFIISFSMSLFNVNIFSGIMITYNIYVALFMSIGLVFSIITLIISYILSIIF